MNGNKYLLDTNALIHLLGDTKWVNGIIINAEAIFVSIISYIEFLSYSKIDKNIESKFAIFISRVNLVGVDDGNLILVDSIISIRKKYKLKLPDSIIAAAAISNEAIIITADQEFSKIKELKILILE